jgi:hypothetical protein
MATDRQRVVTMLTLVIVVLWAGSMLVRIWVDFPAGAVLDSVMPLVCGYWFVARAASNGKAASSL